MDKMENKKVQLTLPDWLHTELKMLATQKSQSVGALIRIAITEHWKLEKAVHEDA